MIVSFFGSKQPSSKNPNQDRAERPRRVSSMSEPEHVPLP